LRGLEHWARTWGKKVTTLGNRVAKSLDNWKEGFGQITLNCSPGIYHLRLFRMRNGHNV